jgi:hypothetical protein
MPPPARPAGSYATTEYTVVKGDTLAKIAKAHGVTLKALRSGESRRCANQAENQPEAHHSGRRRSRSGSAGTAAGTDMTGTSTGGGVKLTPSNPATR